MASRHGSGLAYLDTGAMYRAMTWALLQRGTDLHDPEAIARDAEDVGISSGTDPLAPTIEVDGQDVSGPIRGADVTGSVSLVAAVPRVRELLVQRQRDTVDAAAGGIVVEGRDIGSAVVPARAREDLPRRRPGGPRRPARCRDG